jgi:hypothetical protein
MRITITAAALLVLSTVTSYAQCAIVYQHSDYQGRSLPLSDGAFIKFGNHSGGGTAVGGYAPRMGDTWWNDQISSFKLRRGCSLYAWQHADAEGNRRVFTTSYKKLGSWNDQISTLRCGCGSHF